MSHFTVLVIGPDVEKQLQPFHEFECTGTDDEFVQDLDILEDARAEFPNSTRSMVRLVDGTVCSRYDERFGHTDPTTGARSWTLPADADQFEEPYPSLAEYLRAERHEHFVVGAGQEPDLADTHKYGYALVDEHGEVIKAVRRTNPNKKWDWWVLGGRWAGHLRLKPGAIGQMGRRGQRMSVESTGRADRAFKGDVDFEGMRAAAADEQGVHYDRVREVIADRDWRSWETIREVDHPGSIEAARVAYHAQPVIADLAATNLLGMYDSPDRYRVTRDEFVAAARDASYSTFALLKDGEWYESGRMGWWGTASDKKEPSVWNREFSKLVDGLPDDTLLSIIDCHI